MAYLKHIYEFGINLNDLKNSKTWISKIFEFRFKIQNFLNAI